MTIKPGTEVFYAYTIPIFNTRVSGYGRVLHGDYLIGTDDAYAIEVPNGTVAYVRKTNVEEVFHHAA